MATVPFWIYALFFSGNYEYASALVFVPVVVIVNLMLVSYTARGDRFLGQLMRSALLLKVVAASGYLFVTYTVYREAGDVLLYFNGGRAWATEYLETGRVIMLAPFWGTNFILMMTGALLALIGPSLPTAVVLFSMAAYWGQYFFYRAFCIAFPQGNQRLAALVLFLLPSGVFWSATIGKEAVITFCIGLAVYGFARATRAPGPRGFLVMLLGTGGVLLVRPHIALMLALSFTVPYLLTKQKGRMAAKLGKLVAIPVLLLGTSYLWNQAEAFLGMSDVSSTTSVLERVSRTSHRGGSAFGEGTSLGERILLSPFLLFRPFPFEAHNIMSAFASLEGLLLMFFFWQSRRHVLKYLRNWRSSPFSMFVLLYTLLFSVIFAGAVTNFGIMTRQRIMVLPMALMLLFAMPALGTEGTGWRFPRWGRRPRYAPAPIHPQQPNVAGSVRR